MRRRHTTLRLVWGLTLPLVLYTGRASHAALPRPGGVTGGAPGNPPVSPMAPPPLPFNPYGTVAVSGTSAEPGTVVGGWCDGTEWDTFAAESVEGETWYSLEIPGDDPETPAVEGCASTGTVTFTIGGVPAAQTAPWVSGQTRVDLTAATTALDARVRKEISVDGFTWHDADVASAYPAIEADTALTWRLSVTNTGALTVTLALTDTLDGVPIVLADVCAVPPPATLTGTGTTGAAYACTIEDGADLGTHRNLFTMTIASGEFQLTAADAAGYVGVPEDWNIYLPTIFR